MARGGQEGTGGLWLGAGSGWEPTVDGGVRARAAAPTGPGGSGRGTPQWAPRDPVSRQRTGSRLGRLREGPLWTGHAVPNTNLPRDPETGAACPPEPGQRVPQREEGGPRGRVGDCADAVAGKHGMRRESESSTRVLSLRPCSPASAPPPVHAALPPNLTRGRSSWPPLPAHGASGGIADALAAGASAWSRGRKARMGERS